MSVKFIKIRSLNHQNPRNDCDTHLRVDRIAQINGATQTDKNLREEINSVVFTVAGEGYATKEFPETILKQIAQAEAESSIPGGDE